MKDYTYADQKEWDDLSQYEWEMLCRFLLFMVDLSNKYLDFTESDLIDLTVRDEVDFFLRKVLPERVIKSHFIEGVAENFRCSVVDHLTKNSYKQAVKAAIGQAEGEGWFAGNKW